MDISDTLAPRVNPVFQAKLISKKVIARGTEEFTFVPDGDFDFLPGQYAWIQMVDMKYPDPSGDCRAMSIANIPNDNNELSFIMRKSSSGFKKTISALKNGDEVKISGPFGSAFTLPPDTSKPVVMIGGGTGITPFLSLSRHIVAADLATPSALILVDRSAGSAVYAKEVETLSGNNPDRVGKVVLSTLSWDDLKDIPNLNDTTIFVSGPQPFIDYVADLLSKNGVFEHQVHYESNYPTTPEVTYLRKLLGDDAHKKPKGGSPTSTSIRHNMFSLAVQSSSQHVVITDVNGVVVFANSAAESITGYSFDEMRGNTPRLWGGLMSKEFYEELWGSKLKGHTIDTELMNRRKDGSVYRVMAHIAPMKDISGRIIGFIGTEEDITAIVEAKEKAAVAARRFQELTEAIPELYWLADLGEIEKATYVSSTYSTLFCTDVDAMYKNPRAWIDCIVEDDRASVEADYNKLVDEGTSFCRVFRVSMKDKNTTRWVEAKCERISNTDTKEFRLVGVARDVSKEREIDREKTEFVSLASHQLKTPLGAISWNAEMLLGGEYGKLPADQKPVIKAIQQTNDRMRELVNNLLDISRIEMGTFVIKPEPIDFIEVCNGVLTDLKPKILKKHHKVTKDFQKDLGKINADSTLLSSIMQNYISNAIKYTPSKGSIKVAIGKQGDDIVVSVANNGEPIPPKDRDKIFSKSFRASNAEKQDHDGNGLGLYLVKSIAESGGGKAWFDSEKGKDTVFSVSFPATGMTPKG